ncbi:MAG: gliding motility-associated C-terminal domain-containing protein [Flavobacteriales bacterium]|nr:gliding motility-associated C-terminal domain-containing protein [Flavobacteriales bacterium]
MRTSCRGLLFLMLLMAWHHTSAQTTFFVRFEPGCGSVKAFFEYGGTDATAYTWDFGDGTTSTAATPVHRFEYEQPISVSLTIQLATGSTSTFAQSFPPQELEDPAGVRMPNVFTPNGDGVNDVFRPVTDVLWAECASLQVLDRWGHTLFRSQGNDIQWNGRTMAGMEASTGTYYYILVVNGAEFHGTVQLLR